MLQVGLKKEITIKVEDKDTAMQVGSGTLAVFATPRMIALMEECAYKCIAGELDSGSTSVGTLMNVSHLAATPVGMQVTAVAEVTAVEGRRVSFKVTAFDEAGLIGEGVHDRFIVFEEKFMAKTYSKLDNRG